MFFVISGYLITKVIEALKINVSASLTFMRDVRANSPRTVFRNGMLCCMVMLSMCHSVNLMAYRVHQCGLYRQQVTSAELNLFYGVWQLVMICLAW